MAKIFNSTEPSKLWYKATFKWFI